MVYNVFKISWLLWHDQISARKSLYISMAISLNKFQEAQLLSQMIFTFLRVLRYCDMLLLRKFVAIDNFHHNIAISGSPSIIIHTVHLWHSFINLLVHHQCLLCAKHCIKMVWGQHWAKQDVPSWNLRSREKSLTLKKSTYKLWWVLRRKWMKYL